MSNLTRRYVAALKDAKQRFQKTALHVGSNPNEIVRYATELYDAALEIYALGVQFQNTTRPQLRTTVEGITDLITSTTTYYTTLKEHLNTKVFPPINQIKLLARGNRDDFTAIEEVRTSFTDSATQAVVDKAEEYLMMMAALGLDQSRVRKLYEVDNNKKTVTAFNQEAMGRNINTALDSLRSVAPASKIAPNGYIFSMTDQRWVLNMESENYNLATKRGGTATGDLGAVTSVTWGATSRVLWIQLLELDTTGYTSMPPKSDLYEWKLEMTAHAALLNDKGTGAQGAVVAADKPWYFAVRGWTADSVDGATISEVVNTVQVNDALTSTGDATTVLYAQLALPVEPLSSDATKSRYIHVDWAAWGVDTANTSAGGQHFAAGKDFTISNVRLVGYPKERLAPYTEITYRDSNGRLTAIGKDATFVSLFGKLTISPYDDPNFSVEAVYRDRLTSGGHMVGAMIEALQLYSADYHKGSDTIDAKYIAMGVPGGIRSLHGVREFLNKDRAPFNTVTDYDKIALIFATLVEDVKILAEGFENDSQVQTKLMQLIPYTTSSNVSV
jgi:hypothetical protein